MEKVNPNVLENILFPELEKVERFEIGNYVRVTKGLYKGDLAQITGKTSGRVTVQLVPRLNFEELNNKIKFFEERNISESKETLLRGKSKIFKEALNYLTPIKYNYQRH